MIVEESLTYQVNTANGAAEGLRETHWPAAESQLTLSEESPDHFIQANGYEYAGGHVIIDLWGATNLDKLDVVEEAFKEAVRVCGATLLHMHFHHFQPNGGISGVAVLAESHISIHTWPERNYAALDVFMCGDAKPLKAVEIFRKYFSAETAKVSELQRGRTDHV